MCEGEATPLKTFGGKARISKWILKNFPPLYENMIYVEGFLGGASVLLRKKKSILEVGIDICTSTIDFWNVAQNRPEWLCNALKKIEYSEDTFNKFRSQNANTEAERAIKEFTLRRMSRSGRKDAYSWSDRLRGGRPENLNSWSNALGKIKKVAKRIQDVKFLNGQFLDLCDKYDGENTLFYLDPPYLHETRTSKDVYDYEMSYDDHAKLLDKILTLKGKVIISGYVSPLYHDKLRYWQTDAKSVKNNSGEGKVKQDRIEVVWFNYG